MAIPQAWLRVVVLLALVWLGMGAREAFSQETDDPLVVTGVKIRIEADELRHQQRLGLLTGEEYTKRNSALSDRRRAHLKDLGRLPRDQMRATEDRIAARYQVEILPYEARWKEERIRADEQRKALETHREEQLKADASTAANLQAGVALRERKVKEGTLAAADSQAEDALARKAIAELQSRYDGFGGPWGVRFGREVRRLFDGALADATRADRLADTTSDLARDALEASRLILEQKRHEFLRSKGKTGTAEEEKSQAQLSESLRVLTDLYGASGPRAPLGQEFKARTELIVGERLKELRPQWEKEAAAERTASRTRQTDSAPSTSGSQPNSPVAVPRATKSSPLPSLFEGLSTPLFFAITITLGCLAGLRARRLPRGPDPGNPMRFRLSGYKFELNTETGVAVSPSMTESHYQRELQFFLRTADGREVSRQFSGSLGQVALRDGHIVSVVWAIREGQAKGPHVLVRNHATGDVDYLDETAFMMKLLNSPWAALNSKIQVWDLLALALLAPTAVGAVAYAVLIHVRNRREMKQVRQHMLDVVVPLLDREAQGIKKSGA